MKLSTKGRYAVMALADLANFSSNSPISLRDISLRQGISIFYLEQIFLKLKKNKIVNSVRGSNGGYILNKNPSQIKISEVFQAVDEKIKTIGCSKNSKKGCNGKSVKCITHNLWDELEGHINVFFENKNISDLVKKIN
jgi:Rrf2 family iron-sulfur cluster assembly transcriptional regulator